jgi:hypothetical protein
MEIKTLLLLPDLSHILIDVMIFAAIGTASALEGITAVEEKNDGAGEQVSALQ